VINELKIQIKSSDELVNYKDIEGTPELNESMMDRQRPDATWLTVDESNNIKGRCSLWWGNTPELNGEKVGAIGYFAADSEESASEILSHGIDELKNAGVKVAVGPMDGNTWNRYRYITQRGQEPSFFLEPDNPDKYPGYFKTAGFIPLAQYFSSKVGNLAEIDPKVESNEKKLAGSGITFRNIRLDEFDDELKSIYEISIGSFGNNFLYTPISEPDFVEQYTPIREYVHPHLVHFAEKENVPVGFIFSVPDLAQAQRGEKIDTVIAKSMAVVPEHRSGGLGGVLIAKSHQAALDLGYAKVIHALMYESNHSRKISDNYAKPFRRYTLFFRELDL
jgi:GNAT superfamily N-acetyltransferase